MISLVHAPHPRTLTAAATGWVPGNFLKPPEVGGDEEVIEYESFSEMSQVGTGSRSTVFKATWSSTNVAVKLRMPFAKGHEDEAMRFEVEARELLSASHPNVVRFYGAGTRPANGPLGPQVRCAPGPPGDVRAHP